MRKTYIGALGVVAIFLLVSISGGAADSSSSWGVDNIHVSPNNIGTYSSIAVDSYGNPHVVCSDSTDDNLKYFHLVEGQWLMTTISDSGEYSSIDLDSNGNPHISYYDGGNLNYSYYDGDEWWDAEIDLGDVGKYSSIALDSDDTAHITYYDDTNNDLKYARQKTEPGAEWYEFFKTTVDSGGDVGKYSSIAIGPNDNSHISYYDASNTDLKYARSEDGGSTWTIDYADENAFANVGLYSSIAIDSNGWPYISYYDSTNEDLIYAAGWFGHWSKYTVDSSGDVGMFSSLAIDSQDNLRISYYDYANKELKYAFAEGYTEGYSEMNTETVDTGADVGYWSSIGLDSDDVPHISYWDSTNYNPKYARINTPPNLTSGSVSPEEDKWGETFTFQVTYQDDDGDAPFPRVRTLIDGKKHLMTMTSGTYETGATYEYEWTPGSENIGSHTYDFSASNIFDNVEYVLGGSLTGPTVNQHPPTANFSYSTDDLYVNFTDESSDDDGSIDSWEWDFDGDGTVDSTDQDPSVTYQSEGDHDITLTVTDDDGATDSYSDTVTVSETNESPSASFNYSPTSPVVGETIDFDASDSSDPEGSISTYSWDFDGDGANDMKTISETISWSYEEAGMYSVSLTVEDDEGATDKATVDVSVNSPPTADFSFTTTDLSAEFTDGSSDDGSIDSWEWDFDGDGTVESNNQNPSYTYSSESSYDVTLTVTDDEGVTDSVLKEVSVGEGNSPPTAKFSYTTDGLSVDFSDKSSDPDGTNDLSSWGWDFDGDGTGDSSNQNPSYTYSSEGDYDVTLTVQDSEHETDEKTKTVTVSEAGGVNQAPNLSSGSVSPSSGEAGTTFTYEVNYQDPDNDEPRYVGVWIDGSFETMEKSDDNSYVDGVTYQYQWSTSPNDIGDHTYFFKTTDLVDFARLPAEDNYSGPEVKEAGEAEGELTVSGYVKDNEEPVEGAAVTIGEKSDTTDSDGYFEVENLEGGKDHEVSVDASGHESYSETFSLGNQDKNLGDINLQETGEEPSEGGVNMLLIVAIVVVIGVLVGAVVFLKREALMG